MTTNTNERPLPRADAPPARRRLYDWFRFALVGASGILVNQAIIIVLTEVAGLYYLASAVLATFGSSSWNFVGAETWVFAHRRPDRSVASRYVRFLSLNLAFLVGRVPMLWVLTDVIGMHYAISNLITLVAIFALRVGLADGWIWREGSFAASQLEAAEGDELDDDNADAGDATAARASDARYRYDVAGVLAIESDVELRELRSFASRRIGPPDIRITIGMVETRPGRRVSFQERGEELVYREHLGPISANFTLRMGDPIQIKVSPVLAMSPHVVYTNIVEAFLRFLLVSKGYVLLHSAALVGEHGATLLSAQTDTGKTSTVITLVRNRGYRFLSDDMTIIDPAGVAVSYPKPMTLSFHTMGVAKDGRLTVADRAKLSVQSRVHSKSGRTVGRALGERNVPIMTINSAVQFLVPPPKHRIDDLFECAVGGRAPIRNVVLMERGSEVLESVSLDAAVEKLLENTDDAYGFPPFALFAPKIRIGGDDYAALRRKEAELLRSAIANAALWHLRVKGHEWADRLPAIIDQPPVVPVGPGRTNGHVPATDLIDDLESGVGVAVGPGVGASAGSAPAPMIAGLHAVSVESISAQEDPGGS
jgi:dolichol-phosphate mannosyltransferase